MNAVPFMFLWVNEKNFQRHKVMKDLFLKYKFHFKKTEESQQSITFLLSPLISLYETDEYKNGMFEIMDINAQLLSE